MDQRARLAGRGYIALAKDIAVIYGFCKFDVVVMKCKLSAAVVKREGALVPVLT
jgi:hypothetical protein